MSCNPDTEIIMVPQKSLIPEGIAVGPSGEIYLSNIYAKNIIRANSDGAEPKVIWTRFTGEFSGVGITEKNGKLYNLANTKHQSVFQIIDIEKEELFQNYLVSDTPRTFLNDLAVTSKGKVYITDSDRSRIYTIENDSLVVFIESDEIQYPNGIALSDDEQTLYMASFTKGIRIYDLLSGQFVNEVDELGVTRAIDGLKYYQNSLIGIQNASRNPEEHCIVRFYLDNEGSGIDRVDTLFVNHPTFNIPTTFDIKDGWVYCLSNSQLDNLDQEKMQLINEEDLTDTYILKFKLK